VKALWITSHKDTLNSIRPEAETLIGLARAGVQMEVMTQGDSVYRTLMEEAGVEVIDCVPNRKLDLGTSRFIRDRLKSGRHDILHLFNNKAITNGLLAARGLPVKVITYRGQTGNMHRYDPTCWLTHLNPRIDRIMCVADAVRDDLRNHVLHPERVITVYKGHDLAWYRDDPADLKQFGIPADAFVVTAVANYRPRKGLEVLVDSTRHLPAEAPIHFLLVGDGMDNKRLARRIEKSPFRNRIHVAGFRQDACSLVAASQVSVLAATKREGLPKTVVEAMVYSVPPIVTDTGGSAELVVDGDCGLVVPPGDPTALARAVLDLYKHRDKATSMGRRARNRIDTHFNIRDTIRKTLGVYDDVIEN
jgi:glycosyltransferase involved in cell wall biosynthesis